MFFNTKKYKEEAEKNRKHNLATEPSRLNMICLAILATFAPTRILLRLHKTKITDNVNIINNTKCEQIPIIYFHGFRGGDYTTNAMVKQALKDKGDSRFLKVTVDLWGNYKLEGTWTDDAQPIVQVVFRQRLVGIYAIDYYLRLVLPFLAKRYHFTHYTAVAHSLACPCIVRTEMRTVHKKHFPRLDKCVFIAGPFDGVTYLGDIPNVNGLNENGRPAVINFHYLYLLFRRKRFNPKIQVLNIYGNVLDNTNSDKFISVISAKSIRYILAPSAQSYHEVEIRGKKYAEHSWMHDNPFVIDIVDKFIGLKE
ncbi:alpha/beta hydrolase [Lactobacillus sp. ESL0684]|uniref:alpha/beta hydrolase n=1 Tax=unclassified Lactobacillus TaxID=2620435 RepID=UPI0023F9A4A1|nr:MULTISPECIES: alpha/beta hydrolase [unclassified Lactobacillus]WEV39913.1 alpha/beta hydrolase [Lactobacillus sp. ESL0681]WEV43539.1 alpha/beta hydrolase [Lactobacillus sp. ESL0684]